VGGEKHLKLFDPSQSQYLYEGHIPEAILSYSFQNGFSKKTLLESTSMVHFLFFSFLFFGFFNFLVFYFILFF